MDHEEIIAEAKMRWDKYDESLEEIRFVNNLCKVELGKDKPEK